MPDDLFEVFVKHLGITDSNVLQKEINWKINQLLKEDEAVVRRWHHMEEKQLLRREVILTGSVLSVEDTQDKESQRREASLIEA